MVAPLSTDLLESLLESTAEALYVVSEEGRTESWNWGAETMFGYARDLAVGMSIYDFIVPRDRADEEKKSFHEARETGSSIYETMRQHQDGSLVYVRVLRKSIPSRPGHYAVSEKDVTEAKRFEQEISEQVWSLTDVQAFLKSILDSSTDYSIVATDMEGRVQQWNAGAKREYGYDSGEVQGKDARRLLFAPEFVSSGRVERAFEQAKDLGRSEGEFPAIRRDGQRFPLHLTISLRRGAFDAPVGYVLIGKNIQEQKRIDQERRIAQDRLSELHRLKEMDQFKTKLLNTASHELNTPLTPLRMQIHLLSSGKIGEMNDRQKSAVSVLDRNVERLASIVKDILDVARLQEGGAGAEKTPVRLETVVAAAVEKRSAQAKAAGLELTTEIQADAVVMGDEPRLVQVLDNVLSNAIKFTPKGGKVQVVQRRVGVQAEVAVTDTGDGLREDDIAKLFRPFSQVHDTMQRTDAGTGLGLYISRGIVEEFGGHIECTSPGLGRGATFTIKLPLGQN